MRWMNIDVARVVFLDDSFLFVPLILPDVARVGSGIVWGALGFTGWIKSCLNK